MNLLLAIMHIYPAADPTKDFVLQDDSDGKGAYIAEWRREEDQPTIEDLQAAWEVIQYVPPVPIPKTPDQIKIEILEEQNIQVMLALTDLYETVIGGI